MREPCTCHITETKCTNPSCQTVKEIRATFKIDAGESAFLSLKILKGHGVSRKNAIRALRRELNHKNNLGYDIFEQMAERIWD